MSAARFGMGTSLENQAPASPFDTRLRWPAVALLTTGLLGLLATCVVDMSVRGERGLQKTPPSFDPYDVSLSALLALCAVLIVAAIHMLSGCYRSPLSVAERGDWSAWGQIPSRSRFGFPAKTIVLASVTTFCAVAIVLFALSPCRFSSLGREDRSLETVAALMAFGASYVWARTAYRTSRGRRMSLSLVATGFAIVLFVLGMEEISWGQRYLGLSTPESFSGNAQRELNFHNFATTGAETVYYVGAFVGLVAIPFVMGGSAAWRCSEWVSILLPSRLVISVGALATCFIYNMWNILPLQFAYYYSLGIVVSMSIRRVRSGEGVRLEIAMMVIMVIAPIAFVGFGDRLTRRHDLTEYREFLLPIACFLHACEVNGRIRRCVAGTADPRPVPGTSATGASVCNRCSRVPEQNRRSIAGGRTGLLASNGIPSG